ncbi:MAG: hypothetical protein OXC40_04920 [Proteobacteria bacterium]|nr:hypothetical protein [Pseudomonadota bacterium]
MRFDRRRKLKNFLLKPRAQLELVINIVTLTIFFGTSASLIIYFQLNDIFNTLYIMSEIDGDTSRTLSNDWNHSITLLVGFIFLYVLTTTVICIIHSHRMIGPTVAFKRQLNAILSCNYKTRIKLRDGDYYQDLAELFNRLSEQLEQKHPEVFSDTMNPDDSHNVGEYYVNEDSHHHQGKVTTPKEAPIPNS